MQQKTGKGGSGCGAGPRGRKNKEWVVGTRKRFLRGTGEWIGVGVPTVLTKRLDSVMRKKIYPPRCGGKRR